MCVEEEKRAKEGGKKRWIEYVVEYVVEYSDLIFSIVTETSAINCIAGIPLQAQQGLILNSSRASDWLVFDGTTVQSMYVLCTPYVCMYGIPTLS